MIERSRLPLLLLVVAVLGGALALLVQREGDLEPEAAEVAAPGPRAASPGAARSTPDSTAGEPELRAPRNAPATKSAVARVGELAAWPLSVDLELIWAQPFETAPRMQPWGSGRTARLDGRFANAAGRGVAAEVKIVGGANDGRVSFASDEGFFSMGDLYPGLALVEVKAPGIPGSRREVLLGRDRTSLLNIGYGRLATVSGRVLDRAGDGIESARVLFDGVEAWTDETGAFLFPGIASGSVLVEVSKEGYASYREKMSLVAGSTVGEDRIRFVLQEEAGLVITARPGVGGDAPIEVHLLPSRPSAQRGFPWHTVNPVRVRPGTQVRVGGLPSVPIHVRAFQRGAVTRSLLLTLRHGEDLPLNLEFEAGGRVSGRVTQGGAPVVGAQVKLEAPDRTRAILSYFRLPSSVLSNEIVSTLPPAYQEATTDGLGEFAFSTWPEATEHYYLEARSPDGRSGATAVVNAREKSIEVQLSPLDRGTARLVLVAPERELDLRVAVHVSGREPAEPKVVPAGSDIEIDGLRSGTWRVRARWKGGEVLDVHRLLIEDVAELELVLPAALSGVD